jgi:hypothetical protein
MGLGIAGTAAVLVTTGAMLARSGRPSSGVLSVIAPSTAVALVVAFCAVVLVAGAADAYLGATVPTCSLSESHPTLGSCLEAGDQGRQAGAVGLLGGLLAGVIAGCLMAWHRSRSLRMVGGGVIAALGASVLLMETLFVLVLWAA